MTNRVTAEGMYAIKYLDSGGDPDTFSHRHKKLHAAVINEAKRRLMVEIRHKIGKSNKGKRVVYKNIKKPLQKLKNVNALRDNPVNLTMTFFSRLRASFTLP